MNVPVVLSSTEIALAKYMSPSTMNTEFPFASMLKTLAKEPPVVLYLAEATVPSAAFSSLIVITEGLKSPIAVTIVLPLSTSTTLLRKEIQLPEQVSCLAHTVVGEPPKDTLTFIDSLTSQT